MTRPIATWRSALAAVLACVAWFAAAGTVQAQPSAATSAVQPQPSAPAGEAEYRLGAGDVIRIGVFQNPDLTLETRITDAGVISYPLLGTVQLGGLGITAAERLIADRLRSGNFVKQPQVTISMLQVRGNQASVLGQVNRPGRYPLEVAGLRLTDLLAMAGGAQGAGADVAVITGTRQGRPFRVEIDVPRLFTAGAGDENPLIYNGDTIWVDRQPIVYIYGEVQRPGPLRLERGMTLLQALAAGGGLTQRGTEKGIRVHRRDATGSVQVLQPAMDDAVRSGDVVYVRESLF